MITFCQARLGTNVARKTQPRKQFDSFVFRFSGKEWRLALLQSCPPLRRLLDEEGGSLNFPPYFVDRIGTETCFLRHFILKRSFDQDRLGQT
eukprot:COSAG06_NODE_2422_length_6906_cov_3.078336_7_plen_92_part_00